MVDAPVIAIRRQILEVEVRGTEGDGLALQRRLPGVCADVLAPALESALAAVDPGDATLVVDRLEIDLGAVVAERLEAALVEKVGSEALAYFRHRLPAPRKGAGVTNADGAGSDSAVQVRTAAQTVEEAIVAFLRTGRLPWWFQVPPGRALEDLVFETWGADGTTRSPPSSLQSRLRDALAEPNARIRLAVQFSPRFVIAFLSRVAPQPARAAEECLGVPGAAEPRAPAAAAFARAVVHAVLDAVVAGDDPSPPGLATAAWRSLAPVHRQDVALSAALERRWPGMTAPDAPGLGAQQPPEAGARAHPNEPGTGSRSSSPPVAVPADLAEDGAGLAVDHAGLVLLHPFLPRFLTGLGVAAGGALTDPGRALCLLHHLATGELTAPEYRLTVAKALCGVPLEEPVEADAGITPAESEEAVALLEAAIEHWTALRSTTPAGLRGEFLLRPGQLSVDAGGDWLLRVETRAADILLDQLPWGISTIRLPWMDRLMRVEWR